MKYFLLNFIIILSFPLTIWSQSVKHKYPLEFSKAIETALSAYPELHNVSIKFVYKNIKTTMAAQPTFRSLFLPKRSYVIYIDNHVSNNNGILLKDIPIDAQIGIIGHELAHIYDYEKKTNRRLFNEAFCYIINHDVAQFEKSIDQITIEKGLGENLRLWSEYVLEHSNASEKYKKFKAKRYLKAQEIDWVMNHCLTE